MFINYKPRLKEEKTVRGYTHTLAKLNCSKIGRKQAMNDAWIEGTPNGPFWRLLLVATVYLPATPPHCTSLPYTRSAVVGRSLSHSFDRAPNEIRAFAALEERARFGRLWRRRRGFGRGRSGLRAAGRSACISCRKAAVPQRPTGSLTKRTNSCNLTFRSCFFYRGHFTSKHAAICSF